jgi:hypothetical protein
MDGVQAIIRPVASQSLANEEAYILAPTQPKCEPSGPHKTIGRGLFRTSAATYSGSASYINSNHERQRLP